MLTQRLANSSWWSRCKRCGAVQLEMNSWIHRVLARLQKERTRLPVSPEPGSETHHGYSSDQPIRSKVEDRFNRWPFAKRIADTLATRKDPASLVVGLYGPWGDGKTSTLHLMEETLVGHSHVVVVRFNPWLFQSEELLL